MWLIHRVQQMNNLSCFLFKKQNIFLSNKLIFLFITPAEFCCEQIRFDFIGLRFLNITLSCTLAGNLCMSFPQSRKREEREIRGLENQTCCHRELNLEWKINWKFWTRSSPRCLWKGQKTFEITFYVLVLCRFAEKKL